jgi:hypothetical protein
MTSQPLLRLLQNRRSGFSAESRTLQFAGEMRRSADRRYDRKSKNIALLVFAEKFGRRGSNALPGGMDEFSCWA